MPILKSAVKKLRQDRKKVHFNKKFEISYKSALKNLKKLKKVSISDLKDVYSKIDRAAKKRVISEKKASRLKSLASKLGLPAGKRDSKPK